MKRIFSILLIVALLFACIPQAFAKDTGTTTIIDLGDGARLIITLTEEVSSASTQRALKTKTSYKTVEYDKNGKTEWYATLKASFYYNGLTSKCTDASCPVSVVDANWSQQSKNVRISGSTAIVDLVMYHKGQDKSVSYTLTLSCDKDGNVA